MVSGRAGRKNDSQKKNSKVPFIGISVRAISQAKNAPISSAIAWRVIARRKSVGHRFDDARAW